MQEFLKELFVVYYNDVYSYLYYLSRDAALSEDLASEVFLEAVKSIRKFRGESDIKTWLFSIARYKWYGYLRKEKKAPITEPLQDWLVGTVGTPESEYIEKELIDRVKKLLDQEPERTQKVVNMRLEGYSYHEIGRVCSISESSTRVIDHRVKMKIRQILEKEGFGDE